MAEIPLTRGLVAIVDDADFEWLSQWNWHAQPVDAGADRFYARRVDTSGGKPYRGLLMHRAILRAPKGVPVDHRNRDGLDNRRQNIRLCTHAQNASNRRPTPNKTGFRGVYPTRHQRFSAQIYCRGEVFRLGHHATAERAARAYDAAARRLHGEFASLNFPNGYHV